MFINNACFQNVLITKNVNKTEYEYAVHALVVSSFDCINTTAFLSSP